MWKFESSQKDESRAQLTDSSKAYRKPIYFNWHNYLLIWQVYSAHQQTQKLQLSQICKVDCFLP